MSVIAVGGGKGGVGRTLVASGIAVFIAQLGKRVLLVDGHPHAPQLARAFDVVRTDGLVPPWVVPAIDPRGAETMVPGLRVLTATTETGTVPGVSLRHPRDLARNAGVDHTVLDLGSGIGPHVLDAMLEADVMVLVTTPEPAAVEAVYRFCRHVFARQLARAFKGRPVELAALRDAIHAAGAPPEPVHLAERVAAASPEAHMLAWSTLAKLRVRLVVNDSRARADLDLGDAMAYVARQRLGVTLEYLGPVEYDEAVVAVTRKRRPVLVDTPTAKASRHLERIARRLFSVETLRSERPLAPPEGPPEAPSHYEVLGLDRGASDEEVRRAYRRARDIFATDSVAVAGLLTETDVTACVGRIEEARDVLLDPSRRRPYDLSITPPDALAAWTEPAPVEPDVELGPAPEITPETEFTGALLRSLREARGLDLKDVAARTKISVANLRAVEHEEFAALPASVYLRGFVAEMAKYLRLDVEQVTRSYLRRYRSAMEPPVRRGRT